MLVGFYFLEVVTGDGTKRYTYYRCTKASRRPCTERPIRLDLLEAQIASELQRISIVPEFGNWALDILRRENKRELDYRAKLHKDLSRRVEALEKELYDLNKIYMRGTLDDDFYVSEKKKLKNEIAAGQVQLENSRDVADDWITLCENVFKFASAAAETYRAGGIRTKREVFSALGGSFTLTDGKLSFRLAPWFERIAEDYPRLEEQFKGVRTKQPTSLNLEAGGLLSLWCASRGSFRTPVGRLSAC